MDASCASYPKVIVISDKSDTLDLLQKSKIFR